MKRKLISALLVATMTASLVVGCSSKVPAADNSDVDTSADTADADTEADTAGEKIYSERTATIYLNGMDEQDTAIAAMAEIEAMEKYQNVTFNWVGRDADFDTKMPTEIAGGVEVDIVVVSNPINLVTYADKGLLLPLDDLIAETTDWDMETEFGQYAQNAQVNGVTYMLPGGISSWGLAYNKSIFDDAGVAYPSWETPMTYDEYADVALDIATGTGSNRTYGAFYIPWGTFSYGEAILALGGGEQFYTEDGLSNIEDPAFTAALEGVYTMMHEDESMPTHANVKSASTQVTDFMNGGYGMTIGGSYLVNWACIPDTYPRDWEIGYAPLPVDSGEQVKTWGAASGYGIPVTAPDPAFSLELTYDFLASIATKGGNGISAIRTVEQTPYLDSVEYLTPEGVTLEMVVSSFGDPDVYVTEKITGPNNVAYEKVYLEEVEKYLVQEQSLETTISNIKERGDKAILGD